MLDHRYFLPTWMLDSIYHLTPEQLKKRKIQGIITDLDNTLIAWNYADATPELIEWVRQMKEAGIKVMILSNNNDNRVKKVASRLQVDYYSAAKKPLRRGIRHLLKQSGLKKNQVIMVGDQILTDIFVANRFPIRSVLVRPIVITDSWKTKINRITERFVYSRLKKKYPELKWGRSIND